MPQQAASAYSRGLPVFHYLLGRNIPEKSPCGIIQLNNQVSLSRLIVCRKTATIITINKPSLESIQST